MAGLLKRSGMGACEPTKAFPVVASMIADKDSQVRKSALSVLRFVVPHPGGRVVSHSVHIAKDILLLGRKCGHLSDHFLQKTRHSWRSVYAV